MSTQTASPTVRIAIAWRQAYKAWEDGRMSSPSPYDLVYDAARILDVKLNYQSAEELVDLVEGELNNSQTLSHTARVLVDYVNDRTPWD